MKQLTGDLDWSLIKFLKNEIETPNNYFVYTILVWKYDMGPKRIQVTNTLDDQNEYIELLTDFGDFDFPLYSPKECDEFLRKFIEVFYTMKISKIIRISWGGDNEDVFWQNSHEYSCNIIQNHWRKCYDIKVKAAFIIQNSWRHVIANPSYSICRSRLEHEFCDMQTN